MISHNCKDDTNAKIVNNNDGAKRKTAGNNSNNNGETLFVVVSSQTIPRLLSITTTSSSFLPLPSFQFESNTAAAGMIFLPPLFFENCDNNDDVCLITTRTIAGLNTMTGSNTMTKPFTIVAKEKK